MKSGVSACPWRRCYPQPAMYRTPSSTPEATIQYGPFPLAWWKLALAPLLWFLAFVFDGLAPTRLQIDCTAARCEIDSRAWRRPPTHQAGGRDLLVRADTNDRTRGKNGSWSARTRIHLLTGGSLHLESEPLAKAEQQAREVTAFAAGQTDVFRHDSGDKRWATPVAWVLLAAGVALVVDALRRRQPLKLKLSGGTVSVEELGRLRRLPARTVPCQDMRDVRVDWRLLNSPSAREPTRWGATLDLVEPGGHTYALTTIPREGVLVHYEAAVALRAALELPARGPIGAACPDGVFSSWGGAGWVAILSMAWLGLCCGSLAGMATYAVVMVTFVPASLDRSVGEGAMVAAGVGAIGLAALMVRLVLARERDQRRCQQLTTTGEAPPL
jgi:hypothetical protein